MNTCTATARTGRRCTRQVKASETVCSYHGGEAPQTVNAATRREIIAAALAEVSHVGYAPVADPAMEMLKIAAEQVAVKEVLREQVGKLTEASLTVTDNKGAQAIAATLAAYLSALKSSFDALAACEKRDLGGRDMRLNIEAHNAMIQAVQAGVWTNNAHSLTYDDGIAILEAIDQEFAKRWPKAYPDGAGAALDPPDPPGTVDADVIDG